MKTRQAIELVCRRCDNKMSTSCVIVIHKHNLIDNKKKLINKIKSLKIADVSGYDDTDMRLMTFFLNIFIHF